MTEHVLFTTRRLICRRWVAADVDAVYAVYSDEDGARWVDDGLPITFEECERWMHVTFANYASRGYGMFAIDELSTHETVGFCGLVHPGGQREVEIKYAFLKRRWGRGYATEVVPAMLAHAAAAHGINRVIATVALANIASQRVLLKSGLQLTTTAAGETLVYEWIHGAPIDPPHDA